jgi:hypothetical protein
MKIHALAIAALMAAEASAFIPASSRTARKIKGATTSSSKTTNKQPLYMADEYNLDTGTPKTAAPKGLGNGNAARLEKLKADLEREIAEAEADRAKVLQEIAEAEARRVRLEEEATKVATEVEARRKRLTVVEEQQATARAASTGGLAGLGGAAPLVVGGLLGTIAAARSALAAREKVLEETRQEAEVARIAAEKVKAAAGGLGGFAAVSIPLLVCCVCIDFVPFLHTSDYQYFFGFSFVLLVSI